MSVRQLIVDGVAVPVYASVQISQIYEVLRGTTPKRMRDGSLRWRTVWSGKLRTTISGSGVIPAGFSGIDFDDSFTLSCIAHRAVNSAGTTITIPATRRTDAGSTPYGRALVGGKWVPTTVTGIVSNVATLAAVTGATQYQCVYFPEIVVFADPPTETKPEHGPSFGWSLVAEEI